MSKVTADYTFLVDWDNDGDFSEDFEDITADVMDAKWSSGFDGPPPAHATAGTCEILLKNGTGKYSSYNDESDNPLWNTESDGSSYIRPGLKIQILMSIDSGVGVAMWTGLLEYIMPEIGEVVEGSTATLSAYGILSRFSDGSNAIDTQTNIKTGAAVDLILDDDGFESGDDREIDDGQTQLARWWVDAETTRLDALFALQDEEFGRIREGKNGAVISEDRHHISTNHAVARSTYGSGTLSMWNLHQENPLAYIYNKYKGPVTSFNETEEIALCTIVDVANSTGGAAIPIAAGATATVLFNLDKDAGYVSVATWGDITVWCNDQADGLGTDYSNTNIDLPDPIPIGEQLQVSITNNNGITVYVVKLIANGTAIAADNSASVESTDAESRSIYHQRDYPYPAQLFTNATNAQLFADFAVSAYKDLRPRITFSVIANVDDAHLAEVQALDVGDRITINADGPTWGLYIENQDFIIDKMSHHVEIGGIHTVEITATVVPVDELEAITETYTARTITVVGDEVPDGITCSGWYAPPYCYSRAYIAKYSSAATTAEFRAKWYPTNQMANVDLRTVSEGGTFAHNGTTDLIVTGIAVDVAAASVLNRWTAGSTVGKWYYAWRINSAHGSSVWTDGNATPSNVSDYISMANVMASTGPPANWNVWLSPTGVTNQYIPHATRPLTNGGLIVRMLWQVRDCAANPSPTFDQLDSGTSPAATKYDGSAANHTYTFATGTIQRSDLSGGGWSTAAVGDLIAIDVRNNGASFDIDHCNFETVAAVTDTAITVTTKRVVLYAAADSGEGTSNPVWNSVRIMVVNPWWEWDTEGYLGGSGIGYCDLNFDGMSGGGDAVTTTFTGPPITVPEGTSLEDLYVRAAFLNDYSMSDGGIWSLITDTGDYVNTNTGDSSGVAPGVTDLTCCQMIRMYFDADDTLLNLVGAVDGQQVLLCLVNTSASEIIITLDTKYRNGKAFPTVAAVESGGVDGLDIVEEEEESA